MKINLPADKRLAILSKFNSFGTEYAVVLMPITSKQEKSIDVLESVKIGDNNNYVYPNTIYCYGEIDFTNDDELSYISNCDWNNGNKGMIIPANYDFETHTCEDVNMTIGHHETFDNVKLAKYGYACCGKPKSCVIFKMRACDLKNIFNNA